jgi:toxin ParE1/3/4
VADDFDRFIEHMGRFKVRNPAARIRKIIEGTQLLRHSPLIGRIVEDGDRELVIRLRSHRYVARYRFEVINDTVLILAIRSQSEEDYKRGR